ncbi:hypothetical protein [Maledivibacter halophilus]|uniref:Uncharacterized protein n=1 Tax=Maledivibacter halophilus TaxID=36842 RepID=A0A1T5LTM2_9FIRM|nr:hypothetical protein [Maledivibacter halophilus]SKC79367.1 hypothetical protein SAMN02194393_03292 [Maledivibacter halophilus]
MKISSVKKNRIHTNFVDRNTTVNKTDAVQSISPIPRLQNSSNFSSENSLFFYDEFYDNIKDLKEEYKSFYHNEQILGDAIVNFDKNRDKLLRNMKDLISKYNNAVNSLISFDKVFGTKHVNNIENLLNKYKNQLENLGIHIVDERKLELDEYSFIKQIEINEDVLGILFEPTKGLILKLYSTFRNIKIPKKEAIEREYDNIVYKGMILDNKT